ncbi:MAG: DUF1461 domain-containing protein [Gammaproteobacteria bacterium]|nr:DUF1461 domain-containing protein [Gammaproteobacteria bacterium]
MTERRVTAEPPRKLASYATLQWTLYILAALVSAAYIAWLALAQVNFLYPVWHDLIGIDRTIEIYGPQNRYRQGLELTSKAERSRLFAGIVDGIHDRGAGLDALAYHDNEGHALGTLLREPEILHLKDVAALVDTFSRAGIVAIIASAALLQAIRKRRLAAPPAKSLLPGLLVPMIALAVIVLVAGPVNTFYWLHTVVFPAGHEWFFYYQDSLMSTMMRAPVLFGYIALVWALLTLLLLTLCIVLGRRMGRA